MIHWIFFVQIFSLLFLCEYKKMGKNEEKWGLSIQENDSLKNMKQRIKKGK